MSDAQVLFESEMEAPIAPTEAAAVENVELLDEEEQKELIDFLLKEYKMGETEMAGRKEKWDKWRKQREGKPLRKHKDHPTPNASNVCVPLALIQTNAVASRLISIFGRRKPFWKINAQDKSDRQDMERARSVNKLMQFLYESPYHLDMDDKLATILYETGSLGDTTLKVPWSNEKTYYYAMRAIDPAVPMQ